MIAQILPSLNLPTNIKTETFSYLVPQKFEDIIKIGHIVEINFRNKKIQGIVIETINNIETNQNINKLKEINKIIQNDIKITQTQLDIIDFINNNYYVSKASALKTILPVLPKNKK